MTVKMVHYDRKNGALCALNPLGHKTSRVSKSIKRYKSTKTITRIKHGLSALF
jgi:hypothetical protein